ncbi:MAG: hypothetical protein JOS17DRAFT_770080 [Linnemannia elongata]|nr:MAG: hypothetical protein JOS17DRAFT_770080 [Linnemannia elongata]
MLRLFVWLLSIFLATLAHVTLFSELTLALPASNSISARSDSNATSSFVALHRRSTVRMDVKWLSNMDTWWVFTRKYSHEITLTVDHSYAGSMKYSSKNFNSHCHDDGIWCATHGDPLSQEMAIWYKGYNIQFPTMTIGCYVEGCGGIESGSGGEDVLEGGGW